MCDRVLSCVVGGLESPSREDLLALLALQQRQIEDPKSTVVRLTDEVVELRARLGRNSGYSSMPQSSDMFVKPERRKKRSSGQPRGKQPGAPGRVAGAGGAPGPSTGRVPGGLHRPRIDASADLG
ncbi:DUF6444 domain-containing protein [Catenulispora sp. EB89]|uniref:DUF6444 domain-containing protein n=1 Tax=Catenulispora sp. EB89 TaxID=3156257 RepID=UPI003517FDBE